MGLRPRLLTVFGLGVAAVASLVAVRSTHDLVGPLIENAKASYGPVARVTHVVPPLEASFVELLRPAVAELQTNSQELSLEIQEACTAVRNGDRPWSSLPSKCLEDLKNHRAGMVAALNATHAARLDFAPDFVPLRAENWSPPMANGVKQVHQAAKLAALDIRMQLAAGAPAPAQQHELVDECIDVLALGRDMSHVRGLMGSMGASAITRGVMGPCGAVFDVVSPNEKRRAIELLRSIRHEQYSFEEVLRDESVFSQLAWARAALTPSELSRLPPEALALAAVHPDAASGWQASFAALGWRTIAEQHRRLLATMALPRDQRADALTQVHSAAEESWNPFRHESGGEFGRFYKRCLRTSERLELLIAAAEADAFRSEHPGWPTLAELRALRPEVVESPILLEPSGAELKLSLPDIGLGIESVVVRPDL